MGVQEVLAHPVYMLKKALWAVAAYKLHGDTGRGFTQWIYPVS